VAKPVDLSSTNRFALPYMLSIAISIKFKPVQIYTHLIQCISQKSHTAQIAVSQILLYSYYRLAAAVLPVNVGSPRDAISAQLLTKPLFTD